MLKMKNTWSQGKIEIVPLKENTKKNAEMAKTLSKLENRWKLMPMVNKILQLRLGFHFFFEISNARLKILFPFCHILWFILAVLIPVYSGLFRTGILLGWLDGWGRTLKDVIINIGVLGKHGGRGDVLHNWNKGESTPNGHRMRQLECPWGNFHNRSVVEAAIRRPPLDDFGCLKRLPPFSWFRISTNAPPHTVDLVEIIWQVVQENTKNLDIAPPAPYRKCWKKRLIWTMRCCTEWWMIYFQNFADSC